MRLGRFDEEQAASMLAWPHSGFHVHTAVRVSEDDRVAKAVIYRSDKSDGPTAGPETVDPVEFLARVLVHIPDTGHVTTRYYGGSAHRPRGLRRQAEPATAEAPPTIVPAPRLAPTEATPRRGRPSHRRVQSAPRASRAPPGPPCPQPPRRASGAEGTPTSGSLSSRGR